MPQPSRAEASQTRPKHAPGYRPFQTASLRASAEVRQAACVRNYPRIENRSWESPTASLIPGRRLGNKTAAVGCGDCRPSKTSTFRPVGLSENRLCRSQGRLFH